MRPRWESGPDELVLVRHGHSTANAADAAAREAGAEELDIDGRDADVELSETGQEQVEVDIEREPDAVAFVEQANGGNRTVPTVVFPDESVATNPSFSEVRQRLAAA